MCEENAGRWQQLSGYKRGPDQTRASAAQVSTLSRTVGEGCTLFFLLAGFFDLVELVFINLVLPIFVSRCLIQMTDTSHPDYEYLTQALHITSSLAQNINETKRQKELGEYCVFLNYLFLLNVNSYRKYFIDELGMVNISDSPSLI